MTHHLPIRQPFDLTTTLEMGQVFRWRRIGDWYSGVLGEYLVHLRQVDGGLEYRVGGEEGESHDIDLGRLLHDYFRLGDDLEGIHGRLGSHRGVAEAIDQYPGLRLLRQDPWECLLSYLLSATNSIGGIRQGMEKIARLSHRKFRLAGEERYGLPGPADVVEQGEQVLAELELGLASRVLNIYRMASHLARDSSLSELRGNPRVSTAEAVRQLDSYRGIGPKIASCVALMSLDRLDAFPVDRWVGRALARCDLSSMPGGLSDRITGGKRLTDPQQYRVAQWARDHFGGYAGYANQYLFHWIEPQKQLALRGGG